MNDPKMTARERLRPHSIRHEEDELGVVSRVVLLDVAIQIAEEHAAAAVAELERERDSAVALANALLLDIGKIAEALGSEASEPAALLADAQALKARVAELEGILHDAPTIDAVESHVPGWLARVRAALGKEAQT